MLSGCGKRGGMGCWSAHIFRTELMKQCSGCFKTFSTPPPHFPHPPPSAVQLSSYVCVWKFYERRFSFRFSPDPLSGFPLLSLQFCLYFPVLLIWIHISLLFFLFLLFTATTHRPLPRPLKSSVVWNRRDLRIYFCVEFTHSTMPFTAFTPLFRVLVKVQKLNCGFLCVIRIFVRLLRRRFHCRGARRILFFNLTFIFGAFGRSTRLFTFMGQCLLVL